MGIVLFLSTLKIRKSGYGLFRFTERNAMLP